jgi:Right handed beta helix region
LTPSVPGTASKRRWTRTALVLAALGALAVIGVVVAGALDSDGGGSGVTVPGSPGGGPIEARCDRFAAPSGDDDAGSGTRRRPYATPQHLVRALGRGETGCLRAGTYEFDQLLVSRPQVTLAPYRDAAVTLRGGIKVLPGAAGSVIEGMTLNGNTGAHPIGPRIYADRAVLRGNEITNEHAGICVQVARYFRRPPPVGVVIERNRIHDCGELPPTNHDHGIYLSQARETIVRDNWIYDNADRGIQQYPDAQGTTIVGNVIYRNGEGINFSGKGGLTSSHNLVYSGPRGPDATGNLVTGNCLHADNPDDFYNSDGGIEPQSRNFDARDNAIADPDFVDAGGLNLRLTPGTRCANTVAAAEREQRAGRGR